MAGRRQHYIPQCVLRPFAARTSGKTYHLYVFRRGQSPFLSPTEDVAVQRYFYSKPSLESTATLDDKITEFEATFAPVLASLRAVSDGDDLSPEVAADVVVHLAVRNAHIRDVFQQTSDAVVSSLHDMVLQEEGLRSLLGLDSTTPSPVFVEEFEKIAESLKGQFPPDFPKPLLLRIMFAFVRERFSDFYAQQTDSFADVISLFAERIPDLVRNAHRSALEKSLIPPERKVRLAEMQWKIRECRAHTLSI